MISTGVKYLDKITGGFRLGDNVVWQVSGGAPVDVFIRSFFYHNENFTKNIIYVNFNYSPQTIFKRYNYLFSNFNAILVDAFTKGKGKGDQVFLDFYSGKGTDDKNRFICIEDPRDMKSFISLLNEIEEGNKDGAFYIFDSLTGMNELWRDETAVLEFFSFTCPKLYDLNTLAYWVYEMEAHSKEFIASLSHITQIVFALAHAQSNYFELRVKKLEDRTSYQGSEANYFRIIEDNIQFQESKNDIQVHIGSRVKELRKHKKITQSELAQALGMTPGAISQIENDLVSPSLTTLIQLSSIFNKSMDYFLSSSQNPDKKGYAVYNKLSQVASLNKNLDIYRLFENANLTIEAYLAVLKKGKSVQGPVILHKGREFINIVKGSMYCTIEGDVHYLKEGDTLVIETSFIEKIYNKGAHDCRFYYFLL